MRSPRNRNILILSVAIAALAMGASGCPMSGPGLETPGIASNELSNPDSFIFSGDGTSAAGGGAYLLADSNGNVTATGNSETASFADPSLPLTLATAGYAYFDQMASGSCGNLDVPYSAISGAAQDSVTTQISASQCTDQAIIQLTLDTSQILDNAGDTGTTYETVNFTVDNAPIIATNGEASGNTHSDGTGATNSVGIYSIGGVDSSLVATFSKSLTGGTITATMSGTGCPTIATSNFVSGSNGTTVVWTLNGVPASGTTPCTLNVSGVTDGVGNAEDPSDTNVNMSVTFE